MTRRHDLLGVLFTVASVWLWFDISTSLFSMISPLRLRSFEFCLPFFVACLDSGHWTLVADIAIVLNLAGVYLMRFDGHAPHMRLKVKDFALPVAVSVAVAVTIIMFLLALDPLRWLLG